MQIWRSHPILFAATIGAVFGGANAILIELGGLLHRNSTGVLALLFPSSVYSSGVGPTTAMQTALLLLIEVAGNVLAFAVLFTAPVALFVGIRRIFSSSKSESIARPRNGAA